MGGDNGIDITIEGACLAMKRQKDLSVIFFGNESLIIKKLKNIEHSKDRIEVIHCDKVVEMDTKPIDAIRRVGKESSMWGCINAVSEGKADIAISAGNTGALMGLSTIILRTIDGIERAAISSLWPNKTSHSVVLDLGANVEVTSDQLVQFGILGYSYAKSVFSKNDPTIGLLNIGHEEMKGTEIIQDASIKMKELFSGDYIGYVEGDNLSLGKSDVVVTDGFTGNIALKTAEGTARLIGHFISDVFGGSTMGKLGYLIGKSAFRALKDKMDPRELNGGVFLGLNGLVVKSHGGTDILGFSKAIEFSTKLSQNDISSEIKKLIAKKKDYESKD